MKQFIIFFSFFIISCNHGSNNKEKKTINAKDALPIVLSPKMDSLYKFVANNSQLSYTIEQYRNAYKFSNIEGIVWVYVVSFELDTLKAYLTIDFWNDGLVDFPFTFYYLDESRPIFINYKGCEIVECSNFTDEFIRLFDYPILANFSDTVLLNEGKRIAIIDVTIDPFEWYLECNKDSIKVEKIMRIPFRWTRKQLEDK